MKNVHEIANVRCVSYDDSDELGYFHLAIELCNGFRVVASLCKVTGEVSCHLWDESYDLMQWRTMRPVEFLAWREVACGREPREYFGPRGAAPAEVVEVVRRQLGVAEPAGTADERAAALEREIEEQVQAIKADSR